MGATALHYTCVRLAATLINIHNCFLGGGNSMPILIAGFVCGPSSTWCVFIFPFWLLFWLCVCVRARTYDLWLFDSANASSVLSFTTTNIDQPPLAALPFASRRRPPLCLANNLPLTASSLTYSLLTSDAHTHDGAAQAPGASCSRNSARSSSAWSKNRAHGGRP